MDDFRFIIEIDKDKDETKIDKDELETQIFNWLNKLLEKTGLVFSKEKTQVIPQEKSEITLIHFSKTADRIQNAVSGGFDAHGGTEIISAIEGLFDAPQAFKPYLSADGILQASFDMRDDTVARFAAGKFRSTFRSLRPLLLSGILGDQGEDETDTEDVERWTLTAISQEELDNRARIFAFRLINK